MSVCMEPRDAENGSVDLRAAAIVCVCEFPHVQKAAILSVYTETETEAFQKCSTLKKK